MIYELKQIANKGNDDSFFKELVHKFARRDFRERGRKEERKEWKAEKQEIDDEIWELIFRFKNRFAVHIKLKNE